jgi:hypothetical protein
MQAALLRKKAKLAKSYLRVVTADFKEKVFGEFTQTAWPNRLACLLRTNKKQK